MRQFGNLRCCRKILVQDHPAAATGKLMSAAGSQPKHHCRICGDPGHRGRDCPYIQSEEDLPQHLLDAVEMDAASEVSRPRKGAHPGLRDEAMAPPLEYATPKRRAYPGMRQVESPWEAVGTPMWMGEPGAVRVDPQHYNLAEGDMMAGLLTEAEKKMIAKSRAKKGHAAAKKKEQAALTGIQADYPSLSHTWSEDVAFNLVASVRSRMITFQWKKLFWQCRVRQALAETYPQARWKRNPRWLAMLLGKEVAALWGHLGAMRQRLHAPMAVALM